VLRFDPSADSKVQSWTRQFSLWWLRSPLESVVGFKKEVLAEKPLLRDRTQFVLTSNALNRHVVEIGALPMAKANASIPLAPCVVGSYRAAEEALLSGKCVAAVTDRPLPGFTSCRLPRHEVLSILFNVTRPPFEQKVVRRSWRRALEGRMGELPGERPIRVVASLHDQPLLQGLLNPIAYRNNNLHVQWLELPGLVRSLREGAFDLYLGPLFNGAGADLTHTFNSKGVRTGINPARCTLAEVDNLTDQADRLFDDPAGYAQLYEQMWVILDRECVAWRIRERQPYITVRPGWERWLKP
jgi:hypothetical protein